MLSRHYLLALLLITVPPEGFADRNILVGIQDGWIVASQGADESLQSARIRIWGPSNVSGQFHQLDEDSENEYVVISRGIGSGPYYKLQIVDFPQHGIVTWSYDSAGAPRVEGGFVYLGELTDGYAGAATTPRFQKYRLSVKGLSRVNDGQSN